MPFRTELLPTGKGKPHMAHQKPGLFYSPSQELSLLFQLLSLWPRKQLTQQSWRGWENILLPIPFYPVTQVSPEMLRVPFCGYVHHKSLGCCCIGTYSQVCIITVGVGKMSSLVGKMSSLVRNSVKNGTVAPALCKLRPAATQHKMSSELQGLPRKSQPQLLPGNSL